MIKRIAAIMAIFLCTSIAWAILGSTIFARTYRADNALTGRVSSTWGAPQVQAPPEIKYVWQEKVTVTSEENGKKVERQETQERSRQVSLESSNITGDFHLDYR